MRTAIWMGALVALSGCYEREEVCAGGDCDSPEIGASPFDTDGDGQPDTVPIDDTPATARDDLDDDGVANEHDPDDDGDGFQDDVDVDVDGDGLLENLPSAEVLEATWTASWALCDVALNCCSLALDHSGMYMIPGCAVGQYAELAAEFAQAAATAGAVVDQASWWEEYRTESPRDNEPPDYHCPDMEKGQRPRVPTIDERVLPYFHGTKLIGEPCMTRWDCEEAGRCDGLTAGSGQPGTCGIRPIWGGPCGTAEPYCPVRSACTVAGDGKVCGYGGEEGDLCLVFELGGHIVDDCSAESWCDESHDPPACGPLLDMGDPCDDNRQCAGLECDPLHAACGAVPDGLLAGREQMESWCPELFGPDEAP